MSISRAMRTLVIVAMFGLSPALSAGDLRNLPLDWRRAYWDFIVLTYGIVSVTNTFSYYFGSSDSTPAVSSEQTDIIDAYYLAEYELDMVPEWVTITTSDEIDIEFSPQEFIELQHFSPVLAQAIRDTENQYRMRLPVSSALLKLFLRLSREIGKGRPIFYDYSLEQLAVINFEADRLKGGSLITLINSYNRDQYRPFRAPHVMPVCPSIPQPSISNDAVFRHCSVDSLPPKNRKRAESTPHVNLCLPSGNNKKKDKSHQNICLPASPRETAPNMAPNERRKSQLKTATWIRPVSMEPAQPLKTESTTTASSTVNMNDPQSPLVRVVEWSSDPGYQEAKTLIIPTITTSASSPRLSGVKKTDSDPLMIEVSNSATHTSSRASSPRSKFRRKNTVDPSATTAETDDSLSGVKKTTSEVLTTESSSTATISVKTTSRRSRRTAETSTEPSSTASTTTTTADSSTTEAPTSPSILTQLTEWSQDPKFQPIVSFYYPYKLSDAALADLLLQLNLDQEKDRTFALSLISDFAAQGFSHRLDDTLINVINLILPKLSNLHLAQFLKRLDLTEKTESSHFAASLLKCFAHHGFPNDAIGSVIHALESTLTVGDTFLTMAFRASLGHADRHTLLIEQYQTAALLQKHWRDYKDSEIVNAWTYSEALLSRYLPPLIETGSCKPEMSHKISPLTDFYNNFVKWIILEVKPSIDESKMTADDIGLTKEELKLDKEELKRAVRFLKIADQMIKIGNYHTAFTIFTALNKATFLDQAPADDSKNLYDVFSVSVNFAKYRKSVDALRLKGSPYLFIANFYGKDFAPLEQNSEGYKGRLEQEGNVEKIKANEKESALNYGKFFQQMHEHQLAARYECTAPKGLVSFFINIAKR